MIFQWLLMIAGMAVVTYLPRALPFVIMHGKAPAPFLQRFLSYIPPAVLGALIFPGVFSAVPGVPAAPVAGGLVAAALAWRKANFFAAVAAGVLVCMLTATLLG